MTTPSRDLPSALCEQAARALAAGKLVCFPTETTYGLAADPRLPQALAALAALKGRAESSPIALCAADLSQARSLASVWPAAADELARRHWPGALTLVVPARADLSAVIAGPAGVGVRVPGHAWARKLAAALGHAITATSANPVGQRPALSVEEARAYFGDAVAFYLDAGPSAALTASTVVSVNATGEVTLIRAGAVDLDR